MTEWLTVSAIWFYAVLFVISVVLLRVPIRPLRRQSKKAAFDSYWNLWVRIDRWLADHPELRPQFYDGKDLQELQEGFKAFRYRVEAAAKRLLDAFTTIYAQRDVFDKPEEERICHRFMQRMYSSSAGLSTATSSGIHQDSRSTQLAGMGSSKQPNNSMHRTALRTAADAQRSLDAARPASQAGRRQSPPGEPAPPPGFALICGAVSRSLRI